MVNFYSFVLLVFRAQGFVFSVDGT
jgi:hypothetical protein